MGRGKRDVTQGARLCVDGPQQAARDCVEGREGRPCPGNRSPMDAGGSEAGRKEGWRGQRETAEYGARREGWELRPLRRTHRRRDQTQRPDPQGARTSSGRFVRTVTLKRKVYDSSETNTTAGAPVPLLQEGDALS